MHAQASILQSCPSHRSSPRDPTTSFPSQNTKCRGRQMYPSSTCYILMTAHIGYMYFMESFIESPIASCRRTVDLRLLVTPNSGEPSDLVINAFDVIRGHLSCISQYRPAVSIRSVLYSIRTRPENPKLQEHSTTLLNSVRPVFREGRPRAHADQHLLVISRAPYPPRPPHYNGYRTRTQA